MLHLATLKGDPLHSNSIAWGENQEQQGSQVRWLRILSDILGLGNWIKSKGDGNPR